MTTDTFTFYVIYYSICVTKTLIFTMNQLERLNLHSDSFIVVTGEILKQGPLYSNVELKYQRKAWKIRQSS